MYAVMTSCTRSLAPSLASSRATWVFAVPTEMYRAAAISAAIGLVLGVLYLFPIAADLVSSPALARHLDQIGPLPADLDIQATIGVNSLPLTPWQGLGVVALWTAGALLLGGIALQLRDA